ncbi:NTP transferase domain-containing protein [Priestia aryabhattai]|uniref:NTP transferase domain-containing protein n=1 Tax=Priestia aryabhattai TaxID=412384 RepID=A0AAX6NBU8_PRIAR|nr:sugar phosphate nucleotidyltransferase [Priestia aryabhattai]MDU9693267.1 NTP transferase domain-containing protein [Priestia aryabhattai]
MTTSAIVLAAGKGTRMKSELPKVLHQVCEKPMILHIIDKLDAIGVQKVIAVVGHKAEIVKEVVGSRAKFAKQTEQKGTGHAVMQAAPFLNEDGHTLIITGDTPLIQEMTLTSLIENHIKANNDGTVLITKFDNPMGYGRIIRNSLEEVVGIVEEKDASEEVKEIKEVNTGIFCFKNKALIEGLPLLDNNNVQSEYYLTDMVSIFNRQDKKFGSYLLADNEQVIGINDREQLAQAEYIMKKYNSVSVSEEEIKKFS